MTETNKIVDTWKAKLFQNDKSKVYYFQEWDLDNLKSRLNEYFNTRQNKLERVTLNHVNKQALSGSGESRNAKVCECGCQDYHHIRFITNNPSGERGQCQLCNKCEKFKEAKGQVEAKS